MPARLGIMLVDDHAVVRMGFRMLLEAAPDIAVVAEAPSGEVAIQRYEETRPDVVVMDLSMPGMGGLEALKRLAAHHPRVNILVLSAHEDTSHPRRALAAGAKGYLCKRGAPEALLEAVRTVAAGRRYLDPSVAQRIAIQSLEGGEPLDTLSEREFEVFLQLARGLSVGQIAENLSLSPSTVGTHLYNVKQKLGAQNQAELTLIALRAGLIEA